MAGIVGAQRTAGRPTCGVGWPDLMLDLIATPTPEAAAAAAVAGFVAAGATIALARQTGLLAQRTRETTLHAQE